MKGVPSNMKFSSPSGKINETELISDYESAEKFDKLRVGKKGVYFPYHFGTRYLPYEYIENAFIRIHEVNGKLCCGSTVFQYFRLVFVHDGKETDDYISENEEAMTTALKAISSNAPEISIGFNKDKS